jgi:hypothetical protein
MHAKKWLTLIVTLTLSINAFGEPPYDEYDPSIAADPNYPRFFAVYQGFDNDYDDEEAIYLRIYYFDNVTATLYYGTRLDSSHDQDGHNADPDIAMTNDAFVVAWTSNDADDEGILARVFDPNVDSLTDEFPVNVSTAGKQHKPAVALDDHGRFMAVWVSGVEPARAICGRIFNIAGLPLSTELTIADTGDNFSPSVAVDHNGVFTVAWAGGSPLNYGVNMRQYYSDATAKGTVMPLSSSIHTQPNVSVDVNRSGNILVAWDGHPSSVSASDIYAQAYDPNGNNPIPDLPLKVNTFDTGKQEKPSASLSDSGSFVIAWQSENSDGNDYGICGREYDPNCTAAGEEFHINLYKYRKQYKPDLAIGSNGFPDGKEHFFTVWERNDEYCDNWDDEIICESMNRMDSGLDSKPEPNDVYSCGDATGNNFVDLNDLAALVQRWLEWGHVSGLPNPDYYPDGHIDMIDFTFIASNWMQCCQPSLPSEAMEYYHQNLLLRCSFKLKGFSNAINLYAWDYGDEFPPNLEILTTEVGGYLWPDELLMCPAVCPHTEASDYVYRADDLDGSKPPYMITVYDKQYNHPNDQRNVAFVGGYVSTMTETEFLEAIEVDNAYRRSHPTLEEKPPE